MGAIDVLLKIFKNPNDRKITKIMPVVEHINHLEEEYTKLSDDELRVKNGRILKKSYQKGKHLPIINKTASLKRQLLIKFFLKHLLQCVKLGAAF